MDPVSAAASVIAVVQISAQIFDLCLTYYSEVKDARTDIKRLRDEIISLQSVLIQIADLADARGSSELSNLDVLNQPNGPVQQCQAELIALAAKLNSEQGKDKIR
jgi:ankyrin repeat domain-containing protein 50